jgi:hypothetical protein
VSGSARIQTSKDTPTLIYECLPLSLTGGKVVMLDVSCCFQTSKFPWCFASAGDAIAQSV